MRVLSLSFVIVVLDQWCKLLILRRFSLGESWSVIPGFFNLTYLRNTGAVWGILQHQNEWLVLLSFVVLVLMAVFYRWLVDDRRVHRLAIGCMIGGIIGNLMDRIKLGWVTDFLDFHWAANHWPCFNLADAAICVGVGIYAVSTLWMSTVRLPKCEPVAEPPSFARKSCGLPQGEIALLASEGSAKMPCGLPRGASRGREAHACTTPNG